MRTFARAMAFAAVGLILTGCANANSIFRTNAPAGKGGPLVITVDAKQRNIAFAPETTQDGDVVLRWRMCAEAAPDVFSALSTSFTGDLGVTASPEQNADVRARTALALAESASAIERTQTINMLRESMYRTCERFLSGAIGREEFIIQAARDQRIMVAILAIEQLTQTARPGNVILAPGASAADGGAAEARDKALELASKVVTAQGELDAANKLLTTANAAPGGKTCEERLKVTPAPTTSPDKEAYEACRTATETVAAKTVALAQAKAQRDVMVQIATGSAGLRASSVAGNTTGAVINPPSDTAIRAVADNVRGIVDDTFNADEVELMCLVVLRRTGQSDYDHTVIEACQRYIKTSIDAKAVALDADIARANGVLLAANVGFAAALRTYLAKDATTVDTNWKALLLAAQPAVTTAQLNALKNASTTNDINAILNAFSTLPTAVQAGIVGKIP